MKKKINFLVIATVVALSAQAGGLLHNTNQHIAFQRMMARGASTEIDAVFTNPAGIAFMDHDGWSLSLNIQSAYQTRNINATVMTPAGMGLFPDDTFNKRWQVHLRRRSASLRCSRDGWTLPAISTITSTISHDCPSIWWSNHPWPVLHRWLHER